MSQRNHLDFYPGVHVMVWVVGGKPSVWVQAWGGEDPVAGEDDGGMRPRKTTPGTYVIHSCAPYVTRTWDDSKIAWGTPLHVNAHGEVLYETGLMNHRWRPVHALIHAETRAKLERRYHELYGHTGLYDDDHDGFPDRWVFNDFGPWAVRYFRDINQDGRLDAGETLSGEMIHTTPEDEAQAAKGQRVTLGPSHGCIHVSPRGRDRLMAAGAFERGTMLIVHAYGDRLPEGWRP